MQTVKDTNGNVWNVYKVEYADYNNQITPGWLQVDIGPEGSRSALSGIQLPINIGKRWLAGDIIMRVR